MSGDLDYSVVAHEPYTNDRHIQSWYNFVSTAQFVLFIVIMIIIVMNLLVSEDVVSKLLPEKVTDWKVSFELDRETSVHPLGNILLVSLVK